MLKKITLFLVFLLIMLNFSQVLADHPQGLSPDSSLGSKVELKDSTYHITGGKSVDNNLFHSFESFNLQSGESAIFDDSGFQYNISRITGVDYSWINGKITSYADNLYLINPNGLMFGPNASLDLSGSFYATTADYIKLGNTRDKFYSNLSGNSILTSAAPSDFGFLDESISPISLQGRGEITEQEWIDNPTGLHVKSGHSISFIGGDIEISNGTKYVSEIIIPDQETEYETIDGIDIKAPDGRINIVSVKSEGTVTLTDDDILATSSSMGNININDSFIDISGEGGGSLYIRGGQFVSKNSCIQSITDGDKSPGIISIHSDDIFINDGSYIVSITNGLGKGADISLQALNSISLIGETQNLRFDANNYGSSILTYSGSEDLQEGTFGSGGNVYINASDINITDGVYLSSKAYGSGDGGSFYCNASNSMEMKGADIDGGWSKFIINTFGLNEGSGKGGSLNINANNAIFKDGIKLVVVTDGTGNAGDLNIKATNDVLFSGLASDGYGSGIYVSTYGTGRGGNMNIEGQNIIFTDGTNLDATAFRLGNGGNITLNASELISFKGQDGYGGGSILFSNSIPEVLNGGSGGEININSKNLEILDGSKLDVCAYGEGRGGNINIVVAENITIAGANDLGGASGIYSTSNPYITNIPSGDGGNINIEALNLYIKDGGQINASSIATENMTSHNGGKISLIIHNEIVLSGVNKFGENRDGFGSGIYARSTGKNAGEPGSIKIKADKLVMKDGAVIESTVNSQSSGTLIDIDVTESVLITGDSSNIELDEPAYSQNAYLMEFNPISYNQSTSGIFASTKSPDTGAGDAGSIKLSTKSLTLLNGGKISTSSSGLGNAGMINLYLGSLLMDKTSSISSDTQYVNFYKKSSISERDKDILILGDVVNVSDMGDGREGSYINSGTSLIKLTKLFYVSDISELSELQSKYVLNGNEMAIVNSNGETLRFFSYDPAEFGESETIVWFQITNKTFYYDTIQELNEVKNYWTYDSLPYETGDIITVKDAGDGLASNYVMYVYQDPYYNDYYGMALDLNYFSINNINELESLGDNYILRDGVVATLDNTSEASKWYYYDNKWIEKNNIQTVENIKELNLLSIARSGTICNIDNSDDFVYSGQKWIALNNEHQISDINERNDLVAHEGDVANVLEDDGNISSRFVFSDGNWIPFVKAGDAGSIEIQSQNVALRDKSEINTSSDGNGQAGYIKLIAENLLLLQGSSIFSDSNSPKWAGQAGEITLDLNKSIGLLDKSSVTTSAESAGGGKIHILSGENLILLNGKVASNVQFGTGNAGDIELNAKNVLINHSQVQANAEEGDGGAIFIKTDAYLKSSDTIVEATSRRGNDGTVKIESPKDDMNKELVTLPNQFMDATKWLKSRCEARSGNFISRLTVSGRESSPAINDDLQSDILLTYEYLKKNNKISFNNTNIQNLFIDGKKYFTNGLYEKASKNFQQILSLPNLNDHTYFMVLEYLAYIYQSKGFVNKAMEVLKKGEEAVEKLDDIHQKSLYFSRMGDLYLSMGQVSQASDYFNLATKNIKEITDKSVLTSIMNNIANAMAVDERYLRAMHIYDKSLKDFENTQINSALKSKILINIAYVLSFAGSNQETLSAIEEADQFLSTCPDTYYKAKNFIALSLIIMEVKDFFSDSNKKLTMIALKNLNQANKIGKDINNIRIQSEACANIGLMYEINGQYEEAIKQTRKAIFLAQQGTFPEILYLWQWQAGRIFKAMGHDSEAIHLYQNAITTLDPIRKELFSGYRYKTNIFQQEIKPVYHELAGLYLYQADQILKNKNSTQDLKKQLQSKLIAARDVMEKLKSAELQDYFEDECVVKSQSNPTQINFMTNGVALVYPISLEDRLVILLTLSDGLKHINIDVDATSLDTTVREFRRQLQTVISNEFLTNSQKIYDWLIRPLLTDLKKENIHTLVVAPDGILRLFPFSALHDGNKFLIEDYAIATIPSISLTDQKSFERKGESVLLGGLSHAVQNFSPLPSVKNELKDIKKITNSNNMLFNKEYTRNKLTGMFQENAFDVVHLATHGVFAGTAKDSFLLTYEDKLNMNMLEQLMSLSKYKNHRVDLLTLSACQTALGNERSALGLAGVAIKSGVRSAIGTLWYVDDESTSIAIREMYRQLKNSDNSKAQALQKAQKLLIAKSKYWHPIFWAPFLLIGSWI
ncbi:secreted protein containing Filamentous hemagglutinin [Candidatus Magnetomorum sp. HK-1]|nr:secreted protein containing Filamentous hemagglutinin [Candidatus Magnetomorum sp. HK-1]